MTTAYSRPVPSDPDGRASHSVAALGSGGTPVSGAVSGSNHFLHTSTVPNAVHCSCLLASSTGLGALTKATCPPPRCSVTKVNSQGPSNDFTLSDKGQTSRTIQWFYSEPINCDDKPRQRCPPSPQTIYQGHFQYLTDFLS